MLSSIKINRHKCLNGLEINNLKRFNIFYGKYDIGKTSTIEGIMLILDVLHINYNISPYKRQFDTIKSSVKGVFNNNTICCICDYDYHILEIESYRTVLLEHFEKVEKSDMLSEVISFFKENINEDISNIAYIEPSLYIKYNDRNILLDKAGYGFQKMINIIFRLINSKNGVMLIDDIDGGLNKNLLREFIKFIYNIANKLNVQVFLTTKSKETIKIFANSGFCNNDISYNILGKSSKVKTF